MAACTPLPKPFKDEAEGWGNPLIEPMGGYDIRIDTIDGPAIPMAKLLANSVADSLIELEVPSTVKEGATSRYVLKGKTEANWEDTRAPFVMLIHWTLADAEGTVVSDFSQGVQGTWFEWENGDPRIIRTVGREAAKPFAEIVKQEEEILPPTELRGTGLMVNYVRGAPGDGNKSLTTAIKEALGGTDVLITEDPRQVDYVLEGKVGISPPVEGKQKIKLVWKVLTPAGGEVGTATQENSVTAGSLDGRWGNTAALVAAAAIGGIEDILARADMPPAPGDGAGESGKGGQNRSTPPKLKQVPGKAPPPPL